MRKTCLFPILNFGISDLARRLYDIDNAKGILSTPMSMFTNHDHLIWIANQAGMHSIIKDYKMAAQEENSSEILYDNFD